MSGSALFPRDAKFSFNYIHRSFTLTIFVLKYLLQKTAYLAFFGFVNILCFLCVIYSTFILYWTINALFFVVFLFWLTYKPNWLFQSSILTKIYIKKNAIGIFIVFSDKKGSVLWKYETWVLLTVNTIYIMNYHFN